MSTYQNVVNAPASLVLGSPTTKFICMYFHTMGDSMQYAAYLVNRLLDERLESILRLAFAIQRVA